MQLNTNPTIKQPPAYDVSHWEPVKDWGLVVPRPRIVFCKATEGNYYQDDTFKPNFAGLKIQGIYRGAYHFHRKALLPAVQAKYFSDFIRPVLTEADYLVLDVEEGGETAAQLKAWFEYVSKQFPLNPVMIYSRENILDSISMLASWLGIKLATPLNAMSMTDSERAFFRQIPVWTAGYPNNPDLYPTPPAAYIPDQTKWGPVWVWQYSEHGTVNGIQGEVDLDWLASAFLAHLPEKPTQDVSTAPFDGVRRITGTRYGCKFYLTISDPQKVRFEVRHTLAGDRRELVSVIAPKYNAQMAWNGDDWDKTLVPAMPKGLAVSSGVTYIPRTTFAPALIFLQDKSPIIDHISRPGQYHVTSGLRDLVVDGKIQAYLSGDELQYTERHARSINGLSFQGHVMRLTVDGEYPDKGMQLKEAAAVMLQFGALNAFDTGGGGDSVEWINGQVMNIPADRDNGKPVERRVPQFILAYAKETNMTSDHYEYTATGSRAIRTGAGAAFPRIDGGSTKSYFNTNTKAHGGATLDDRFTLPNDTFQGGNKIGMKGDVWVKLYDNNGTTVDGWTALIHMGEPQIKQVFVPGDTEPPPTPTESPVDSITQFTDFSAKKVKLTIHRADGSETVTEYPIA